MSTPGTRFPDAQRWFGFRPESYGPDISPDYSLAGRVRGTFRRLAIQKAFDRGKIESLPPRLFEETLPNDEIKALMKGDQPSQVSGEQLPVLEQDEVEIARVICWAMNKAPVIALYARPHSDRQGYALRFVSEFIPEICDYPTSIPRPLSLGELIDVFNHAHLGDLRDPGVIVSYLNSGLRLGDEEISCGLIWYLAMACVNHGLHVHNLASGIQPVSAYYPNLGLTYRLAFSDWAQQEQEAAQTRPPHDPSNKPAS